METQRLITLSADPRAMDPNTIRQVIREAQLVNTADDNALEFFLDCVTVRTLLDRGESDRAALCAQQLGLSVGDFKDTTVVALHSASGTYREWEVTISHEQYCIVDEDGTWTLMRYRPASLEWVDVPDVDVETFLTTHHLILAA